MTIHCFEPFIKTKTLYARVRRCYGIRENCDGMVTQSFFPLKNGGVYSERTRWDGFHVTAHWDFFKVAHRGFPDGNLRNKLQ